MNVETLSYREHEEVERVLKNFETKWQPRLRTVSLITELDVPETEVSGVITSFGQLMRAKPAHLRKILPRIPACVAVTLTVVAIKEYEGGKFWPGLFGTLGAEPTQLDAPAWGNAFVAAIRKHGLPQFASGSRPFVWPILAHAGIPNYCLPDYFRALDTAMRHVGADADAVASWASARAHSTLVNIDVPVRDFLSRGDEFSVDFIDRSMDLLDRLGRDEDPSLAALPERIVVAARLHLERTMVNGRRVLGARLADSANQARVRLDAIAGEVILDLPSIAKVDDDLAWIISADGTEFRVTPPKQMGGRHIGVRESAFVVKTPVRSLLVSAIGVDRQQEIDIVDAEDPVIFFSDSGEMLPSRIPLPGAQAWALWADGAVGNPPHFADLIVRREQPPLGWTGWQLGLLNLAGKSAFALTTDSPQHTVKNDARVTLETRRLAPSARAAGLPVHTVRPLLHIPDGIDADWRLTVVDVATGTTIVDRNCRSSEQTHDTEDPFADFGLPVTGRFAISMRGPLGKGISRNVVMAEDLAAVITPRFRRFTRGGLVPARARLNGPQVSAGQNELQFDPDQVDASTTLVGSHGALPITVAPPAMAVAMASRGIPTTWQYSAAHCASEDVAEASLIVRVPADGAVRARVISDSGEVLQELSDGSKSTPNVDDQVSRQAVFDLAAMSGTVRDSGACSVELGGDESIRVLRVEPRRIASGVIEVGDELVFTDFAGASAKVRVWSVAEPWIGPQDFVVAKSGAFEVPRELATVGSLAISVWHDDPWVPKPAPNRPNRFNDHFVRRSVSGAVSPITRALHLGGEFDGALTTDEAWALLAMRIHVPRSLYRQEVVDVVTRSLGANPTNALTTLALRNDTQAERVALLVSSGLLWTPLEEASHPDLAKLDDDKLASAILSSPVLGALVATRHLARAHSPKLLPQSWNRAQSVLGTPYREVLVSGQDPFATVGRLDHTRHLDTMSPGDFSALVTALNVVPNALLDPDSRQFGAIQLFESRRHKALRETAQAAVSRTKELASFFMQMGAESLASAIQQRTPASPGEFPIALVSPLSLALTLIARMAARGHRESRIQADVHRSDFETLSRYAPKLLACDIVLAEALVSALLSEHHPSFDNPTTEGDDA
jgi:hypothetical protein